MNQADSQGRLGEYIATRVEMSTVQRGLVYVKTHKTGGSTLLNIILRMSIALKLTCTPPANGHLGYGCPKKLPSTLANLSMSTVFAQHVAFVPHLLERIAPKPPLLVTIMREPVSQAISAYAYPQWDHIRRAIGGTNWTDHIAKLERGVRPGLSCYFNNSQAQDMGYDHYRNIARTVAAYDLILITEEFDKSLMLFKRLLARHGWPLTDRDLRYVVRNNASTSIDQQTMLSMLSRSLRGSLLSSRRRFSSMNPNEFITVLTQHSLV